MTARLGVRLLLLAALATGEAHALWDDRLQLFAAHAEYYDDNVLRQPEQAGSSADRYRVSSLGLNLDAPYARQRLLGSVALNSVRYDKFGQFDLDGHDARAQWQWRPGEEHSGTLAYSHVRSLASLANLQEGVQSFVPNALTTQRGLAALQTQLAGWQLALEGSRREQQNEAEERKANDLTLDRGELRLLYGGGDDKRLGLRASVARGRMPNPQLVASQLVDNSYRQGEAGALGDWRPGGHTRLRAYAGRVWRDYDQLPERNFEDDTWELGLEWTPAGRLRLAALAQRAISETEEINLGFVFVERVAVSASYALGASTELAALAEWSERDYLGEAGQVLGTAPLHAERRDAAALSATYRPLRSLSLSATLRRETRTSDLPGTDYVVYVASLGARFDF